MVPACRHSGPMVQVCMGMECPMAAGATRGCADALVLAEVSAGAGAAVAAEADLVIGSIFNPGW